MDVLGRLQTWPAVAKACLVLAIATLLPAQTTTPPPLENTGKPIVLPYECTPEDVRWAGMACSEEDPCPIYLELTATGSSVARVFAAGNIHTQSVTLYSVLLASEDSGRTWREVHSRLRGAGLERIQFVDTAYGWVAGETLFPLAQDHFLLATADGGRSWRRQPLFPDTYRGSLQQFLFTTRKNGTAVVGREGGLGSSAVYESADGGLSWELRREVNNPLRQGTASDAHSPWRVRADAKSGAYEVEHLEGEAWKSVARFSVTLKACAQPGP